MPLNRVSLIRNRSRLNPITKALLPPSRFSLLKIPRKRAHQEKVHEEVLGPNFRAHGLTGMVTF